MDSLQLFGKHLQFDIPDSERLQFFHRRQHVVAAGARTAMTLACIVQLLGELELPRVLAMAAIDHVTKRVHAFLRVIVKPDPAPSLAINPRDLLPRTEVFDGFRPSRRGHPICDPSTIAASIEAQYEARLLRRSTMHE